MSSTQNKSTPKMKNNNPPNNNKSNNKKNNRNKKKTAQNTGGLRKLPVVKPGNELIAKARKIVYKIAPDA